MLIQNKDFRFVDNGRILRKFVFLDYDTIWNTDKSSDPTADFPIAPSKRCKPETEALFIAFVSLVCVGFDYGFRKPEKPSIAWNLSTYARREGVNRFLIMKVTSDRPKRRLVLRGQIPASLAIRRRVRFSRLAQNGVDL